MSFYFFAPTIIILIPAVIFSIYANSKIRSTYKKYKQIKARSGLTGRDAAGLILNNNGIHDVEIESIDGGLTDHYDPRSKVLRLSRENYDGRSLAAVGIAAHEVGHAIQHANGYAPLGIRSAVAKITGFGSKLAFPLILIGIFLNPTIINISVLDIGIILFGLVVFFALVTLPVEFNASSRAIAEIEGDKILDGDEIVGAKKVLNAAALVYVGAATGAILQMFKYLYSSIPTKQDK